MPDRDPAPTGDLPVLDLDGACEYLELTREEIMVLVPQAIIEISDKHARLLHRIETAELPAVVRHAHTIKSVAASIGAQAVHQITAAMELQARAGTIPTDLAPTLDKAITDLKKTIATLT